jgi:AdoMet-dependent heme synthase
VPVQPAPAALPATAGGTFTYVPHIVAWNLTKRCNLACAHCYISAGSWQATSDELSTGECLRILDEVLDVSPNPMLILTGGEPLLREDLEVLVERASSRGATVVVGTNGTRLTDDRIGTLMAAGLKGVAVSVDSLNARYHDRFRHGGGALADTLAAVDRCRASKLDFVIQTTITKGNRPELGSLVEWAAEAGAVSFNLYFLVPTGRGDGMRGLSPDENEEVLAELSALESEYRGRMMIRSKCQPQIMRHILQGDPESPLLNYQTRCPCGVHYVRITPEGKVTPCPYLPEVAGDLMESSFREIWETSPVLLELREGEVGGRCGKCEYRKVCGGCRARAYAETGRLMGPDDSCAYDPPGDVDVIEPGGQVFYGQSAETALSWSPDARERLSAIPSFVRGVVTARIEKFALEKGYEHIDADVMAEVRRTMPVDFSKKLPFFLQRGGRA